MRDRDGGLAADEGGDRLDNAALALVGVNYSNAYKGSGITYGFNIEDGEITNLVATVKLCYNGNTVVTMTYRYTTGLSPAAPPLKHNLQES